MLTNYHTHSTFCHGNDTPEQIVSAAIDKGFSAIGFSGHGFTPFDFRYCMQDTEAYVAEITRLKAAYAGKLQIYLGAEEDAYEIVDRSRFDYIIGSCHYFYVDGQYYPVDSNYDYFRKCLELFQYDPVKMAHAYYGHFCQYIQTRKPDIIGHFDLITKFSEKDGPNFFDHKGYRETAKTYATIAADTGCLFELNTGAISRGARITPYPHEDILRIIRNAGSSVVLSSDSHEIKTLDFGFSQARTYLKDMGFQYVYCLYDGEFKKDYL